MKRAIKYTPQYLSDEARFSTCSTKYEILPGLYPDSAGESDLRTLAKSLGLKTRGVAKLPERQHEVIISEALILTGKTPDRDPRRPGLNSYLGFVLLPETNIKPEASLDNYLPKGTLHEIVNNGDAYKLGIEDCGEMLDGEYQIFKSDWRFYHVLPLLGYSLEKFLKREKVDSTTFSDEIFSCSGCGKYNYNDNGYTYNYRMIDCEILGLKCGCFEEHALENWQDFVGNTDTPMELEHAEKLEERGVLKHIERFIGGMVDGRGGYFNGERTREGDPKQVLEELLESNPDGQYVFTHDESGQFQTYFSVWQVVDSAASKGA